MNDLSRIKNSQREELPDIFESQARILEMQLDPDVKAKLLEFEFA